jgi:S1-C subfamily serine protease
VRLGRRPSARALAALALAVGLQSGCVPAPGALDEPDLAAVDPLDLDAAQSAEVVRRAREITVRIRTLGCDRLGVGSGFVLPGGLVVTNRHVVGRPRSVSVNTWDGISIEARVDGIATDEDLAVLRLVGEVDLPVAEVRTSPVELGEPIIVVGYPGGGPSTVTTGAVVGIQDVDVLGATTRAILVDAPIRPGNSGGPLLDAQGRVIGVVFALDRVASVGLVVPIDALLERLAAGTFTPPEGC